MIQILSQLYLENKYHITNNLYVNNDRFIKIPTNYECLCAWHYSNHHINLFNPSNNVWVTFSILQIKKLAEVN